MGQLVNCPIQVVSALVLLLLLLLLQSKGYMAIYSERTKIYDSCFLFFFGISQIMTPIFLDFVKLTIRGIRCFSKYA